MKNNIQSNEFAGVATSAIYGIPSRSFQGWKICACLMFLGGGAFTASSQTVLVSNLGQTSDGPRAVGGQNPDSVWFEFGNRFKTGSSGVTVDTFTLAFDASTSATTPSGFTLKLYNSFSVNTGPSGLVATFTGATNPVTAGSFAFTGSATLSANTFYYLIASAPTTSPNAFYRWQHTASGAEDGSGLVGWTIGNDGFNADSYIMRSNAVAWTENTGGSMMFSASTSAIPEPSTYAALMGLFAIGGVMLWKRKRTAATIAH